MAAKRRKKRKVKRVGIKQILKRSDVKSALRKSEKLGYYNGWNAHKETEWSSMPEPKKPR